MKTNVGIEDRAIRLIMGLLIMGAGYYFNSWFGLFGLVLVTTGLCRMCGLYSVFGISTVRAVKSSPEGDK